MPYRRDPVSERFTEGARILLERAYRNPGQWQSTRLIDPEPGIVAEFAAEGIDVLEPDPVRGQAAKTRWARGFVRALWYQHRWYSPRQTGRRWRRRTTERTSGALLTEVGRRLPARGIFPAGRSVRVCYLRRGGQVKARAVARKPAAARWAPPQGQRKAVGDGTKPSQWADWV